MKRQISERESMERQIELISDPKERDDARRHLFELDIRQNQLDCETERRLKKDAGSLIRKIDLVFSIGILGGILWGAWTLFKWIGGLL